MKKIGFIGCGKMAQAMIQGLISSQIVLPEHIIASANSEETLSIVRKKFNIMTSIDNKEVCHQADFLFLAVKPDIYGDVIQEIKEFTNEDKIIITIAAGVTIDYLEKEFGQSVKLVRSMPNTPSLVGEGMSALCTNDKVTSEELNDVLALFQSFGRAEVVDEKLMDAIPAVSGSSPAYVYMFIEALADGAVKEGIPRKKAYTFAAQAVLGAAKMVLETGVHPGELKDQVCTPGGATIEAVSTLEKQHFRASILSAMESCTIKSKALNKR